MGKQSASARSALRLLGYVLLALVTAVGLWAMVITLTEGHIHQATTQHVPWGIWIAMYIYFLGLSAGCFLFSTLVYVFQVKRLQPAGPIALFGALGSLILGGLLIQLDLGHPERFYRLLTSFNPASVMAWMALLYLLYGVIVLGQLYLALRPRFVEKAQAGDRLTWLYRLLTLGRSSLEPWVLAQERSWLKALGIVGIPVAVIALCGEGAIFAVAKARPNWFGGLFPIVVLVSALASGGALLTMLTALFSRLPREPKREMVRLLARLTAGILVFDLLLITSDVLTTLYGAVPHDTEAWLLTLFGPYGWLFWFVQIGVGAVVPILLVLLPRTGSRVGWLGSAAFLILLGMVAARVNLVIPAQMTPAFDSLVGSNYHPRYALGYFPSLHEWLVVLGVVALGVWIFLAAFKLLPLEVAAYKSAPEGGPLA